MRPNPKTVLRNSSFISIEIFSRQVEACLECLNPFSTFGSWSQSRKVQSYDFRHVDCLAVTFLQSRWMNYSFFYMKWALHRQGGLHIFIICMKAGRYKMGRHWERTVGIRTDEVLMKVTNENQEYLWHGDTLWKKSDYLFFSTCSLC